MSRVTQLLSPRRSTGRGSRDLEIKRSTHRAWTTKDKTDIFNDRCKCGQVSLVSSTCSYGTQPIGEHLHFSTKRIETKSPGNISTIINTPNWASMAEISVIYNETYPESGDPTHKSKAFHREAI